MKRLYVGSKECASESRWRIGRDVLRKKLVTRDEETLRFWVKCEDVIWAGAICAFVYELVHRPSGILEVMLRGFFWIMAVISMFYVKALQNGVGDVWIYYGDEGEGKLGQEQGIQGKQPHA